MRPHWRPGDKTPLHNAWEYGKHTPMQRRKLEVTYWLFTAALYGYDHTLKPAVGRPVAKAEARRVEHALQQWQDEHRKRGFVYDAGRYRQVNRAVRRDDFSPQALLWWGQVLESIDPMKE